jgi:hypothetical protein
MIHFIRLFTPIHESAFAILLDNDFQGSNILTQFIEALLDFATITVCLAPRLHISSVCLK